MRAPTTAIRRLRYPISVLVVTIAAVTASAPAATHAAPAEDSQPFTATVTGGTIHGTAGDGVVRYLGVPFAASTAGANRFAPPQPAVPWPGVREAVSHGPQCSQSPPLPGGPALQQSSEDCLTVDLYVPEHPADAKLPVMVWLFGGAFVLGSNAQYDSPARLVRDGQVIVAVPNYRVGPFGFLALPELAAQPGGTTGNYGALDQQAALRWIRDNATAFGGDPSNVTIFGESAGGMSVCTQLASPLAHGLYTKAIVESGSCARSPLSPPPLQTAYQRSADYAASLGCADPSGRLQCLRDLPADRLLDSPTTVLHTMDVTWGPVQDGVVLTDTPENALADGAARGLPMIVGSNAEEGATFMALLDYARGTVPTGDDYLDWLREIFGDNSAAVLDRYPLSAYSSAAAANEQVITDGFFACPAQFTAEAADQGGARVWRYQFDDAPLGFNPLVAGAFHGAEVPYVFSALMGMNIPLPPAADRLSQQIQQSWAQFAHTGDPVTPAFAPWAASPSDTSTTLELAAGGVALDDTFAQQHQCDLWSTIGHIG